MRNHTRSLIILCFTILLLAGGGSAAFIQHPLPLNEYEQQDPADEPYITFTSINDGYGLTVILKNIGTVDAHNVNLHLNLEGGFTARLKTTQYVLEQLPANETTTIYIPCRGLGVGIITDLPLITLMVTADAMRTREKIILARILGPFISIEGEFWNENESFTGYTLYSPMISTKTLLINNSGKIVHSWDSTYKPALSVYLLENGNILRTAFPGFNPRFWGGGIGGLIEIYDWNNTRVWMFSYSSDQFCLHHDVAILPNGNILMIAWEYKSVNEAVAAGRKPGTIPMNEFWPDHIIEVQPTGPASGDIVWEWHLWDHLIQDYDPTKENYGVVYEHPELVDINYGKGIFPDWNHINSIDYHEEYDQILLSVHNFNEIWIIDHSTTTEEAAGHRGGRYGKGGDLLYRWGNPAAYKAGSQGDQMLYQQHDAQWIESSLPGEEHILVFNNGGGRPEGSYSSVDEIIPLVDSTGNYTSNPDGTYPPQKPVWTYTADDPYNFYAINVGGAQRLPNGNTLICDGPHGVFFEVTEKKEMVWSYINQIPNMIDNNVFKAIRYAPEYPGLRQLTP